MYSPFSDKKGRTLPIEKIKYQHLEQLADCDEGHHVEYKLLLEDGGRAQLAKEITSFANCEGGWLIVGIDDKTKEIKPVDKKDYSQRIGKIATRISPMPEFSTRFLSSPDDKNRGVLVVYVYEGRNAPYICNGSIYVRSGSSKEPIKAADRGNIEYLYNRSKSYNKEIENFCKRDYHFPYNHKSIFQEKVTYPIATIYLKNTSLKQKSFLNRYSNRDQLIEFVKSKFDIFESISYSMNSIIFMQKPVLPGKNAGTYVFELYYDWSCKILVPFGSMTDEDKLKAKRVLHDLDISDEDFNSLPLVNGGTIFNLLISGMIIFEEIAGQFHLKEKDYVYCFELENACETCAFFDSSKYIEYIKEYGLPYAHKEKNKSGIRWLKDYQKMHFKDLRYSFIADDLGSCFGFRSDKIFDIWYESNKRYLV